MGQDFFQTWSYLGVFAVIVGTGMGLPIPEELPVVVGGALSGAGQARWYIMLPVAIVAVIIGDSLLYFIGRTWGPKLVERPFIKKHILPPDRLKKIEENFEQYGIRILLFARLTPGIRAPIFLTAGIVRLPIMQFVIADGIYAVPGVGLLFFLGYFFTDQMVSLINNEFSRVKNVLIILVILAVAGYFVYRFLRKPVVTGAPEEMPPIATEVVHTFDSVKSAILHPHAHEKKKPAHVHPPPPSPSVNGEITPADRPAAPAGPRDAGPAS